MPPIAFLFRGDDLKASDADVIYTSIFQAVLGANPGTVFHLRSGAVLLDRFSEVVTAISQSKVHGHRTISHTTSDDAALRATLAATFAASIASQFSHLEVDDVSRILLTEPVECVTASELTRECAEMTHATLKQNLPCYIGCFEVDRGDPLALELAANGLISSCHYGDRTLKWIVPFDHEVPNTPETAWAGKLPFSSIQLTIHDPDSIASAPLSPQGERVKKLLNARAYRHAEDVLIALSNSLSKTKSEYSVRFAEPEFGNARVDVRKLHDYCLNEQHTKKDGTPGDGRAKAYLFRKLLGISRADWRFLAEQLVAGLGQRLVNRPRKTDFGVQYEITTPVVGRNNMTKLVTSGWIIRPNESPFLTSAYIAHEAETTEAAPLSGLVVASPKTADFWQRLYETAHTNGIKSAEGMVPTPMWVEGFGEPVLDGACGQAWVRLPDGRSRFCRWLKKKNLGDSSFRTGCIIYAKTASQSLERAQKYCEGFAQVLRLNGIECEIMWRYD